MTNKKWARGCPLHRQYILPLDLKSFAFRARWGGIAVINYKYWLVGGLAGLEHVFLFSHIYI